MCRKPKSSHDDNWQHALKSALVAIGSFRIGLSLEHRFRFGLNGKIKTEHLTTYPHRPRTTRSPLSFWGDGGIVLFEPFFHAFPGGREKIAINRIFLILHSRKEECEILFPFRRDREFGYSHKKNRMLG
ncbi:hypothetical protein Lal_00018785 [Lupinus albus]|nr:hypothetical protein Lal_00018785 [Lupinus albus]